LTAGLLGQIAEAIGSDSLDDIARVATWALPFEALYQAGLAELTADTVGFTRLAIDLGPFGGAQEFGWLLWPFTALYLGAIAVAALWAFRRRDL
jgi:Cu-processing system permease protein